MLPLYLLTVLRRDSEDDEDDDVRSKLSTGAIAGIAVGAVIALFAVVVLYWCKRHKSRRRKAKRGASEDEKRPLPMDRAIVVSASSDEGPTELQAGSQDRQMTGPMTPAPAYSSIQNIDSSHDAYTMERESELDGITKAINEIRSSDKRAEQGSSERGVHELELVSLKKKERHGDSHSGQELAYELPVQNILSSNSAQRFSEMDGRNY